MHKNMNVLALIFTDCVDFNVGMRKMAKFKLLRSLIGHIMLQ